MKRVTEVTLVVTAIAFLSLDQQILLMQAFWLMLTCPECNLEDHRLLSV
jgi:hypothetical protein